MERVSNLGLWQEVGFSIVFGEQAEACLAEQAEACTPNAEQAEACTPYAEQAEACTPYKESKKTVKKDLIKRPFLPIVIIEEKAICICIRIRD